MATEETSLDVDSELVWVKVRFVGRNPLYICSFYTVPNSSTEPLFQLIRESMLRLYSERTLPDTVLAGGVNLPDMDWENVYVNPSPIHGHEVNQVMLDIANDYGLEQLVCEETRTLDLVFSSRPTLISLHYVSPAMLPQLQGCLIMKLLSSILISQQSRPTKAARKTFIYRKGNMDEYIQGNVLSQLAQWYS